MRGLLRKPDRVITVPPQSDRGDTVFDSGIREPTEDALPRHITAVDLLPPVFAIHTVEGPEEVLELLALPSRDHDAPDGRILLLGTVLLVAAHVHRIEKPEEEAMSVVSSTDEGHFAGLEQLAVHQIEMQSPLMMILPSFCENSEQYGS